MTIQRNPNQPSRRETNSPSWHERTPAGPVSRRALLGASSSAALGVSIGKSGSLHARQQGQPHVRAVVSAHSLATDAGMAMLEKGGTAADAAVAVAAVLSVVEGWFSNVLGGGTWGLYFEAETAELTSLDGVGPVPVNADADRYAPIADRMGMHQAIVPGAWDGWMQWLDRYGRLDLGTVLAPAIRIAREGFPAGSVMVFWIKRLEEDVRANEGAARIYLPGGSVPEVGDVLTNPELADTLEALANAYATSTGITRSDAIQAARDYFYRGPLAEAIVAYSNEQGGFLSVDDFSGYASQFAEPISIAYSDELTVYQCPPNSQGITMLLALNILKGIDFSGLNIEDPNVIHAQVEAVKLAFADRFAWVGDPERVAIPVAELLSDDYAAAQRARIDPQRAMAWPIESGLPSGQSNTSTFHVVDSEGNVAGATTSVGAQFLLVGKTGIHMNARMSFLSLDPQDPNYLSPGYRVRHTSCPYMVFRNGRPWITGANTGVDSQPQVQVQQFISMVDFGLPPQRAINRPRFVSTSFPASTYPFEVLDTLQLEDGFTPEAIDSLKARGHVIGSEAIVGTAAIIEIAEDGQDALLGWETRIETSSGVKRMPGA